MPHSIFRRHGGPFETVGARRLTGDNLLRVHKVGVSTLSALRRCCGASEQRDRAPRLRRRRRATNRRVLRQCCRPSRRDAIVTRAVRGEPEFGSDLRPQHDRPASNCFVAHFDPALRQQLLHVAKAEGEPEVQPDCVADHVGGKAVTLEGNSRHWGLLRQKTSRCRDHVTFA